MKTKKTIIVALISLCTVSVAAGWYMYNKGPKNILASQAVKLSAIDLYAAFANDTTTAQQSYFDKVVQVKGVVDKVQMNNQQQQVVLFHTNEENAYVNCTMEEKAIIAVGNTITIKGICGGIGQGDEDLGLKGDVYLTRSYIVNR